MTCFPSNSLQMLSKGKACNQLHTSLATAFSLASVGCNIHDVNKWIVLFDLWKLNYFVYQSVLYLYEICTCILLYVIATILILKIAYL